MFGRGLLGCKVRGFGSKRRLCIALWSTGGSLARNPLSGEFHARLDLHQVFPGRADNTDCLELKCCEFDAAACSMSVKNMKECGKGPGPKVCEHHSDSAGTHRHRAGLGQAASATST